MRLVCICPYFFKGDQELSLNKIYSVPKWVTPDLTSFGGYIVLNDMGIEQEYTDTFLMTLSDYREDKLNDILK